MFLEGQEIGINLLHFLVEKTTTITTTTTTEVVRAKQYLTNWDKIQIKKLKHCNKWHLLILSSYICTLGGIWQHNTVHGITNWTTFG